MGKFMMKQCIKKSLNFILKSASMTLTQRAHMRFPVVSSSVIRAAVGDGAGDRAQLIKKEL